MTLQTDRVRDYMSSDLLTVAKDMEIMQAVHLMVEKNVSGMPVVDDGVTVGIVAGYYDELGGNVEDFMSPDVHVVSPEDSLMSVAELFAGSSFRRCPVVEDGRVVGLICRRDILRSMGKSAWFRG